MDYIVNTRCGTVKGTAGRIEGVAAYKGIRYATAGRWEYPKQVTHWEGLTRMGHASAKKLWKTMLSHSGTGEF